MIFEFGKTRQKIVKIFFMNKPNEFRLICQGNFADINEAKHALHDPFIEAYVENTGKFNFQDMENINVVSGISLGDLEIIELGDEVYQISTLNSSQILKQNKAEKLAETIRLQAMFDSVRVEPLE